jgi:hypothetical protein
VSNAVIMIFVLFVLKEQSVVSCASCDCP